MKKLIKILILIVLMISGCKENKTDKFSFEAYLPEAITIHYVSFSILMFISIDCEKFEDSFKGEWKEKTITSPNEIYDIVSSINNLKDLNKVTGPDTRCKIYIRYKNGNTDEFCMSSVAARLNGKPKEMTMDFYKKVKIILDIKEDY